MAANLVTSYTPGPPRNDFTGAVGLMFDLLGKAAYNKLGALCGSGVLGPQTVRFFDSTSGQDFGTYVIDMTGKTPGQWVWVDMPLALLDVGQNYVVWAEVTAGQGYKWVDQGACTVRNGGSNVYSAYSSSITGGLSPYAPGEMYWGLDLDYVLPPYSIWSPVDASGNGMTLSNGELTVTPNPDPPWPYSQAIRSSISKTSGKLYVEFSTSAAVSSVGGMMFGVADAGFVASGSLGSSNYSAAFDFPSYFQGSAGFTYLNGPTTISSLAANDVMAVAIDFTAQLFWVAHNNTWLTGDPAVSGPALASFVAATVGALFPAASFYGGGQGVWTLQATAASQKYAPPAGFSAWDGAAASYVDLAGVFAV